MKRLKPLFPLASIVAAFLTFLPIGCCLFPGLFALLGGGSLVASAFLLPYRPYFIGFTFVFLGIGFYFAYRSPNLVCHEGDCSEKRSGPVISRMVFWIVAVISISLLVLPYLLPYLPM